MNRSVMVLLIALTACADSIAPDRPDAGAGTDGPPQPVGKFSTTMGSDGIYTTIVDASSTSAWTHGDFETRTEVGEAEPWDLRFQRFHISTNGGVSGSGGVEVAPMVGMTLEAVTAAPTTGWISDAEDGDDSNLDPDYAFEQGDGWYDYDVMTHVLTPRPMVWVVRTAGGATIKLQLVRYYDDAGTAGYFTMRWAPL